MTDQATQDAPTDDSYRPAVADQVERSVRPQRGERDDLRTDSTRPATALGLRAGRGKGRRQHCARGLHQRASVWPQAAARWLPDDDQRATAQRLQVVLPRLARAAWGLTQSEAAPAPLQPHPPMPPGVGLHDLLGITMGYQLISERTHTALKRYCCIWCGESILPGQQYVREFSTYEGDVQKHKWHPECRDASAEYFREVDDEFSPHDMERPPSPGTLEFESWDCALLKQAALV